MKFTKSKSSMLKRILVSGAALLMLASSGASINNAYSVNAKHVRTHRTVHVHKHSRRNVKRYYHKRNIHRLSTKAYRHKKNLHKYNTRHHKRNHRNRQHKLNLLSSSSDSSKGAYNAGKNIYSSYANGYNDGPSAFSKSKYVNSPQYLKAIYNGAYKNTHSKKYSNLVLYDISEYKDNHTSANFKHGWSDADNYTIDYSNSSDPLYKRGWIDEGALVDTSTSSTKQATKIYNKAINGQFGGYYAVDGDYISQGPSVYNK